MSEQFGFDFGDATARAFALDEQSTWLDPKHTVEQYRAMFAKGTDTIQGITDPARPLFVRGLILASDELEKMVERCGEDDEPRALWRVTCEPTNDEFDAFVAHCRAMASSTFDGIEYKVRDNDGCVATAAMYVRDVGTLIAWRWSETNRAIDFQPWRDSFFLESYRDRIQAIEAPYSTWGRAYCADKLANSNDGIASVPTFVVNGREYINDGGFSRGPYRECEGWSFTAFADWQGATFSYRSQCRAWDNGSLERGDRRGLVVRVRGQLCVLDGAVKIYDTQATDATWQADESDDAMTDDEVDSNDEDALEEEEVTA
ncbi:hypothetical protein [Burkholderia cenocepacia]|uniref:hypothetical protein n=1 Tax=Burkholderia cenocepacia TaxID=95486 RepID=UPI002AB65561|nr:hypothetical protein [Burkholderia cenocepacia]